MKFRIEIIAVIVVVVGAILLFDLTPIARTVDRIVVSIFGRLTPAAVIGPALIAGAGLFIGRRLRVRFLRSTYWHVSVCPRCGGPLHRVHRSWLDRITTNTLLPRARRYRCSNADCRWEGLRRSQRRDSQVVK